MSQIAQAFSSCGRSPNRAARAHTGGSSHGQRDWRSLARPACCRVVHGVRLPRVVRCQATPSRRRVLRPVLGVVVRMQRARVRPRHPAADVDVRVGGDRRSALVCHASDGAEPTRTCVRRRSEKCDASGRVRSNPVSCESSDSHRPRRALSQERTHGESAMRFGQLLALDDYWHSTRRLEFRVRHPYGSLALRTLTRGSPTPPRSASTRSTAPRTPRARAHPPDPSISRAACASRACSRP